MEEKNDQASLKHEYSILKQLQGEIGIPKVHWYGEEAGSCIMVMELLDYNIEEIYNKQLKRQFSLMTVLLIIDQMLLRLKSIHDRGVIHRDVKPENFLVKRLIVENDNRIRLKGLGKSKPIELQKERQQLIYLVDYGLAKQYIDPKTNKHIECVQKQHFIGTAGYSSLNSHNLQEQGRRDDLEGLAHVFYYLMVGSLPWQGIQGGKDKLEKYNLITMKKRQTKIGDLCEALPNHIKVEYALFYNYCRGLEFKEKPDYGYLRRLLLDVIYKESFNQQIAFEWLLRGDLEQMHMCLREPQIQVSEQFLKVPERQRMNSKMRRSINNRDSTQGIIGKENTDSSSGRASGLQRKKMRRLRNPHEGNLQAAAKKPPTGEKKSPVLKLSKIRLSEIGNASLLGNGPSRPSVNSQQPFQIVQMKQSQSLRNQYVRSENRLSSQISTKDKKINVEEIVENKRFSFIQPHLKGPLIRTESIEQNNSEAPQTQKASMNSVNFSESQNSRNQTSSVNPQVSQNQTFDNATRSIVRPGEIVAPPIDQLIQKYGGNNTDIILEEEKTPKHLHKSTQKTFLSQLQQSAENQRKQRLRQTPNQETPQQDGSPLFPLKSPLGEIKLARVDPTYIKLRKSPPLIDNLSSFSPFDRAEEVALRIPQKPHSNVLKGAIINNSKKTIILQRSSIKIQRLVSPKTPQIQETPKQEESQEDGSIEMLIDRE